MRTNIKKIAFSDNSNVRFSVVRKVFYTFLYHNHKENIFILLLAVFSILIYFNSLQAPFIFDDNHMIVENTFIKSSRYLPLFFKGFITSYPLPKGMYRPLLMLTFAFNYLNGGLNPVGYRIINILFHFLNVILLYSLLKLLKKDTPSGLVCIITLLFLTHPINTEAVIYISSRSDLMVTFFIISSFFLYLRKRYILSCLVYTLALLSKETGLCLPILVLAYEFIYNIKCLALSQRRLDKKELAFYAGLALITSMYLIYKSTIFSPSAPRILRSYYSNFLVQSAVTLFYLKLFIFPHPLNILHHVPGLDSLLNPLALISSITVLSLIILIFIFRKKNPLMSLGIAWFLICLLPKFYARLHFVACEHHLYLPSIGIYIILTVISRNVYLKHKRYFVYLSISVISLFAILTSLRSYEYKDGLVFWRISAQRNPKSGTIHNKLGLEYIRRGFYIQAEEEFKKAINLVDRIESTINAKINLANIYITQRRYGQALKLMQACLKIRKPPPPGVYHALGAIYMETEKEEDAISAWQKELRLYPASVETYLNLGTLYFTKGEISKTKIFFQKAIQVAPNHYVGYYGLARVLEKENRLKEAINMYKEAIFLRADYVYSHYSFDAIYAKLGDREAIYKLKQVVEFKPESAQAHNDLAILYASMNPPNWKSAKEYVEIAKSLGYQVDKSFLRLIEKNIKK